MTNLVESTPVITRIQFLRKLQRLLDEGDFSSTYKFALLHAIADVAVESRVGEGDGLSVPLEPLAVRFIEYYWRQALPYRPGTPGDGLLVQNNHKQAALVTWLNAARARTGSLDELRGDDENWQRLVRDTASLIRRMPLWKLQRVGPDIDEFLYPHAMVDDAIVLNPGVPSALREFHGLVLALVRGAWTRKLTEIGRNAELLADTHALHGFLFGTERGSLSAYRDILRDHQRDRCFYCDRRTGGRRDGDVDHFIPWSRYPVDLGHNFVFAHAGCNRRKRDFLAHPDHLARWRELNLDAGATLAHEFAVRHLPHDLDRSRQIAWWAYEQAERTGAHVWIRGGELALLDGVWRRALSGGFAPGLAAETSPPPYGRT